MKATIKDIARHAGVSVSTVSMALSGKETRIAAITKQKILESAHTLNYRRNHLARALVTKKTRTLGIVLPDISNEFFAKIAKGIGYEAKKNDYRIMLLDTNEDPEQDVVAVNMLLECSVDGILYIHAAGGHSHNAAACVALCQTEGIPLVLLDRVPDAISANAVLVNQEKGGYLAMHHLLSLGHIHIGCITGSLSTPSSRARLDGCYKALHEAGISPIPQLLAEGEFHADSGYAHTQALLDAGATAVFAFNDLIAYGVYRYARDKGLRVPQDLSLMGFDDNNFSEIMETPLTTIHQPTFSLGVAAVQKMMQHLNGSPTTIASTIFEPRLIIRKSTGGAP